MTEQPARCARVLPDNTHCVLWAGHSEGHHSRVSGPFNLCVKCGGTEDLMDRAMAPGMTFCGPCRRAMCPDCTPEPATSPVARCRKCGRSECRHDANHHAPMSYDMHTRTECMTCLDAENAKADWRRTQFKPIPVPPGYVHTEHGLVPDPCAGGCTHDHDHTAGGSLPFCSNCPDCLLTGGSTETADREPHSTAQAGERDV